MSRYDIVIAHFGVTDDLTALCCACLRSIREYSADYRVIFVDNGSPKFADIEPELALTPHLLVRNVENAGFIKAANQGLLLSTAPRVVLMNNDTEAVPQWLEKLDRAMELPNVGLAGPRTTTPDSWQGRHPHKEETRILQPGAMLAFFCTMFRREVIDGVGLLNESYGVGLGDDDEYCQRAQRAGWQLAFVQNLLIPHKHRSTFRTLHNEQEIHEMQVRAMDLFRTTA